MAAEIRDKFGVEAELIRGAGGVYDITVDGKLIYCKHDTGEFPENPDILVDIKKLQG